MDEDERCCGTGTCLINGEGMCWCGQQWNGTTMCSPTAPDANAPTPDLREEDAAQVDTP